MISSTRLKVEEQAGPVKSACCLQPDSQAGGSGSVQLPTAARPWCWKALMGIRMADTARGYMVDAMAATTWGSQFWLS